MKYDFHMHTTYSDGSSTPEEVVVLAKKSDVDMMCLTDHDTLLMMDKAKELDALNNDIKVMGGLEISATIKSIDKHVHILAYKCDKNNEALKNMINTTIYRRTDAFYKAVDIINKRGEMHIDEKEIEKYKGINGFYMQHILKYLVDKGYAKKIHGSTRKKLFCKTSGYAHVEFEYPDSNYAIQTIRNAGGIPIVAHTLFSDNFNGIDEMIDAGLMGIEVFHPKHSEEQRQFLYDFCLKRNLLVSCGSDFHGGFSETNSRIGSTSVDNEKIREFVSAISN